MDETVITFVDSLPPDESRRGRPKRAWLDLLHQHPGQWAEVKQYPANARPSARRYIWHTRNKHPDIEMAVRTVGDQAIVYARAIKTPTTEE
jgi:hypothetical protein